MDGAKAVHPDRPSAAYELEKPTRSEDGEGYEDREDTFTIFIVFTVFMLMFGS